ncbi:hypothetical protein [Streptomyces sp. 049-1]|uniref:hypothetical protein n=1 Tax=Streptomyces sp. 049-1 TaxID=2789264 RepID=UPI00397E9D1B
MNDDIEAERATTVRVDTVRCTPLRDGQPDHAWAVTFTPHAPLLLLVAVLCRTPPLGLRPLERWEPGPFGILAALATGDDFLEHDLTQAMERRLHHHAPGGMAVETWTAMPTAADAPPRRWLYHLLPRWTWTPAEDWPLEEPDSFTVHTAGKVTPNPLHTEPAPAPYGHRQDADLRATHYLAAVTETPPPPAGYADPALAAWATSP